jgi:hypothetical protein
MLEAKKYNRNRIILFVLFTLVTIALCTLCVAEYYSIDIDMLNIECYNVESVSKPIKEVLQPVKTYIKHLGYYFILQWVVGLVLFIATKRR